VTLTPRRSRRERPLLPHEEIGQHAAFAKPHLLARGEGQDEQIDTRDLSLRKIHPERDAEFLRWLHYKPCVIAGKTNLRTGQKHMCWSPTTTNGRFTSDPMHTGKAYSGALKRSDHGAVPGCRHAHREQEANMDRFDADYSINRHEIAAALHAEFTEEQERKGLR